MDSLKLDYVLGVALSNYRDGHNELIEPEWILSTPYSQERRGTVRCLKNPAVLRDVVAHFAGLSLENYFYVVVTNDDSDPFSACQKEFLPEALSSEPRFYELLAANETAVRLDQLWQPRKQSCVTSKTRAIFLVSHFSWRARPSIAETWDVRTLRSSLRLNLRLPVNIQNRVFDRWPNRSASTRGVSLILLQSYQVGLFFTFSWRGESCAIRDYSSGPSYSPLPQRDTEPPMYGP